MIRPIWRFHPARVLSWGVLLGMFSGFFISSMAAHLSSAHQLSAILAMMAFAAFVGLVAT